MKNYILKDYQNTPTLHNDKGDPIECIYKVPVLLPHPNIAGQVVIKASLCSNNCPAFQIIDDEKVVFLSCIGIYCSFKADQEPVQPKSFLL
jgi:hypothetical protein